MKIEMMFAIIGFFGTIGLGINAFFLKGIYADLNHVKINLAKIFENSKSKERRIVELEENEKELFRRLNELEKVRA